MVKVICELSLQVDLRQKRVDELERTVAKLSKNSTNSSKPPSSDITRPKSRQRQQGKRKIGAQPGHPRHERPAFPEADIQTFHDYRLDACPECGHAGITFVVIDRRITQGTRSEKGRETCERLWTVVGTCALQGRSAFEFILTAVRAYFRDDPAPSLLPAFG